MSTVYSVKFVFEKIDNKQKGAGVGLFLKNDIMFSDFMFALMSI